MLFNIAVFLLVLGVLVFVHELGHFLAAKACGVYVDRFSLGMPPRIFGVRWGQTDYCIGLLPIGGYVKMAGQEDAPLSDEEREETYGHVPPDQWYNNKTKLQRAFILIAGPAMNMILAFFIYLGMGAFGSEVDALMLETRIGEIQPDSPASMASMYKQVDGQPTDFSQGPDSTGWKVGDRIVSINGSEPTGALDIMTAAVLSEGDPITMTIERMESDRTVLQYTSRVTPTRDSPDAKFATFGIRIFETTLIEHVLEGSPAEQNGLLAGDRIIRVNGELTSRSAFQSAIQDLEPNNTMSLEIDRAGEVISLELTSDVNGTFEGISFDPHLGMIAGIPNSGPQEIQLEQNAFTKRTGLRAGDRISSVNGQPDVGNQLRAQMETDPQAQVELTVLPPKPLLGNDDATPRTMTIALLDAVYGITGTDDSRSLEVFAISDEVSKSTGLKRRDVITHIDGQEATVALMEVTQSTRVGETIPISVRRPNVLFGMYQKESTFDAELTVGSIQRVGVVWANEKIFHKQEAGNVVPYAFSECMRRSTEIGKILQKLITGDLSPKLLGGPVLIYEMTTASARMSIYDLLSMVAMISVNLCIFNLLPLPVLDGGQLTIIGIEAIRRKPVNTRILENVQQAGFFLILGLLVFVTFNDVSRIVERFLP